MIGSGAQVSVGVSTAASSRSTAAFSAGDFLLLSSLKLIASENCYAEPISRDPTYTIKLAETIELGLGARVGRASVCVHLLRSLVVSMSHNMIRNIVYVSKSTSMD